MTGKAAEANFQGEDEPMTDGKGFEPRLVFTGYQSQADRNGRKRRFIKSLNKQPIVENHTALLLC